MRFSDLNKGRAKRSSNEEEDLGYDIHYNIGLRRSNPNFEGFDFNLSDVEVSNKKLEYCHNRHFS